MIKKHKPLSQLHRELIDAVDSIGIEIDEMIGLGANYTKHTIKSYNKLADVVDSISKVYSADGVFEKSSRLNSGGNYIKVDNERIMVESDIEASYKSLEKEIRSSLD